MTLAAAAESQNAAPSAAPADALVARAAPSATLDFANGLYARKMYGPAISEYEKFIRENPASPELASARFRYADSFYFSKNYRSAIDYFEAFVREHATDKRVPMARFRIGTSRYYLGKFEEATPIFVQVSKTAEDPSVRSGALFYLAKSLEAGGKSDNALGIYRQLVKGYPQSDYASYAAVALGDHALAGKYYDEAQAAYQLAADKSTPVEIAHEARFKCAEILFLKKDYAKARDAYQALYGAPEAPAEATPSSNDRRQATLKEKSLLGLFYCDYYLGDLEAAGIRAKSEVEPIRQSLYEPEILLILANLHADKRDFEKSLALLDLVLSHRYTDVDLREKAIFKKSSILAQMDKKEPALAELQRLFGADAKSQPRAFLEKGKVLESLERPKDALAAYSSLLSGYPASEYAKPALYRSGLIQAGLKDASAAKESFRLYLKRYPKDEMADEAMLELIQLELDDKEFEAAKSHAGEFFVAYPQSPLANIAHYKLGVALTGLNAFTEAAAAFSRIVDSYAPSTPLYPEALYGAGSSFENAGKADAALPHYEKLINFYPDHPLSDEALTRLGYLYIKTARYDQMKSLYEEVLFNRPEVEVKPEGVFWLIRYLLDKSDYAAIQRILQAIPARFPDQDFGHEINFFLGESFLGQKDYAKAVAHYGAAVDAKPDGPYAPHAYLGMGIAAAASNDSVSAEKYFSQTLRFDQEIKIGTRARFEIANIRLAAKDYAEAAKAFMLVAILYDDPKYSSLSLYKAGECFERVGKIDEANKAFEELSTRYPKSIWTRKRAIAAHSGKEPDA